MLVNDTQIRCIFPQEKAEAFNISVICDGLSSEPIHFFPSVEDTSSFYVESFANAIDGSTSCATVVGSRLNLIKRADLCDQAVDVARSNATQVLNICVAGRHISCRLQLFDNIGTGLYSTVVKSSSMGVLSIYPSAFVSQSWITVTITAFNFKGSTCSLSGLSEFFVSTSDTLIISHYLGDSQRILDVRCTDVSNTSQSVSFNVFPRNFIYSVAPVIHSSGSSALSTLFGNKFDLLLKACCRIGDVSSFVQLDTQNQAFCELKIADYLLGNVSLNVYHICGERHFLSFPIRLNTRSSVFLYRHYLRTSGDALVFNSGSELQCTLANISVTSTLLNSTQQSCFFNVSDVLLNQNPTVIVRDYLSEPLVFAIKIIHHMGVAPSPSKIAFSGKEISFSGHFPEEISPYNCFCESLLFAPIWGEVLTTRSTLSNLSCVFWLQPSSRCQVGISVTVLHPSNGAVCRISAAVASLR